MSRWFYYYGDHNVCAENEVLHSTEVNGIKVELEQSTNVSNEEGNFFFFYVFIRNNEKCIKCAGYSLAREEAWKLYRDTIVKVALRNF